MAKTIYLDGKDIALQVRTGVSSGLAHTEPLNDLLGAVIEEGLALRGQLHVDLRQSLSVYYDDDGLALLVNCAGTGIDTERAVIRVPRLRRIAKSYSRSVSYIEIDDKIFQVFYNEDHAVLVRERNLRKYLDRTHTKPTQLKRHWDEAKGTEVEVGLKLEVSLANRAAKAAWDAGLSLDEWIADSIEKRFIRSAEPIREELPTSPPDGKLYSERQDKSEKPVEFIRRVYGHWLNGYFSRADLRKIDPQLEMALRNWERTHERADLNLPTLKERNDSLVAEGRIITSDPKETRRRLAAAEARIQPTQKDP